MPIIHLWKEEDIKATESFIKDFTPIAYELCFKDEQTSNLKVIDKIVQSGSRVWMNTLWDSLCGGHDDENALLESKDKHWGWILEHKATMIQTDRPHKEWEGTKDDIFTSTNERLNNFIFASDLLRKVKDVEVQGMEG